ncbi:MAG: peptide chain release factor 1 [Bacteroidota bacterium]
MIEQLEEFKRRFQEIEEQLSDPAIVQDIKKYTALNKEHKKLSKKVATYNAYQKVIEEIDALKPLTQSHEEEEIKQMAKEELASLNSQQEELEEELKTLLLPEDPEEDKSCLIEIRAGAGGDEAAIWAGDLFRMYQRFAEKKGWKAEILDYTEGTSGGYKEIIVKIADQQAYAQLRYEGGVHRVQRVPATESQGRIHTSTASVAVLPEADEVEVDLDMNEIKKETFCSSGPGGQSVNTTYSAVRLTHLPTGITASCQDGKSQIKNYEKALEVLRARLYERKMEAQKADVGAERKAMVGTGDRSEKIRTYNYPQGRITDHRVGYTQHNLPAVLQGDLAKIIEKLRIAHRELLPTG